jgi:hypothetical protein
VLKIILLFLERMNFIYYKEIKHFYKRKKGKEKNMVEILKFVYTMILFFSLFTDASKYKFGRIRKSPFHSFQFSLFISYTLFYLVLVTLFYSLCLCNDSTFVPYFFVTARIFRKPLFWIFLFTLYPILYLILVILFNFIFPL